MSKVIKITEQMNNMLNTNLTFNQMLTIGTRFRLLFNVDELEINQKTFSEKILKLESENKKLQRENELLQMLVNHYVRSK